MRSVFFIIPVRVAETYYLKTYFLKSLYFGYFKICEPKWVTKME